MNEILLYSTIYSYTANEFVTKMGLVKADADLTVRINGGGGEPTYGWAMVAKYLEHKGRKLIKVDGAAHSMYAFFLCYCDDSEAIDVSEFLIHRAAYPDWIESNPDRFTEAMRSEVERCNEFLKKAFEAKVDKAEFEKITGVKIKDIFSMDQRLEVMLTAQQAKKIGLINRVVTITPKRQAEINSLKEKMTAESVGISIAAKEEELNENSKSNNMATEIKTIDDLKANHNAIYKQAVKRGETKERKRIEALMVFHKFASKEVEEAIKSGKTLDSVMMAEMQLKMNAAATLAAKRGENGEVIETEEVTAEKTAAQKQLEEFTALVDKGLGLAKK